MARKSIMARSTWEHLITFVIGSDGILKWVGYGVRAKGHVENYE